MESIIINNEFVEGQTIQLGKTYSMSDDFYHGIEGTVIDINDIYTMDMDDEVNTYDMPNITIFRSDCLDTYTVIVDEIDEVFEIA